MPQHATQQQIRALFPNASRSLLEANKGPNAPEVVPVFSVESPIPKPRMNKTETEFSRILAAMKSRGEITHFAYEGITLRWGDGMRYTGDFVVFTEGQRPRIIEIKGGHIWDRDLVRFKGCRAEWKAWFDFEMHQKKDGEWSRIH